jgi:hypothetical protein
MKKYLIILFLAPMLAFAQSSLFVGGVNHYAKDANVGAADSLHYIGHIPMMLTGGRPVDSIQIIVTNEDTLSYRLKLIPKAYSDWNNQVTDTATITNVGGIAGGMGVVGGGHVLFPWHNIKTALKDKMQHPLGYLVYLIIRPAESAMASRGKQVNVFVRRFVSTR